MLFTGEDAPAALTHSGDSWTIHAHVSGDGLGYYISFEIVGITSLSPSDYEFGETRPCFLCETRPVGVPYQQGTPMFSPAPQQKAEAFRVAVNGGTGPVLRTSRGVPGGLFARCECVANEG